MNDARAYERIEGDFAAPEVDAALARLSDEQRQTLHRYWVDRATGELTTALSFEFMRDDLRAEGAPRTLTDLATTAIADEHRHVDFCLRWARRMLPDEAAVARLAGTRPAELEGASAHDNRLLRTVFGCCFSETVATHILLRSHDVLELGAVRSLNQQHVREEVHHARLGWALLAWDGLRPRDRGMIAARVEEMVSLTRAVWQSTPRPNDPDLEALGFLSSRIVAQGFDEALEKVILPGIARWC